MTEPADLVFPSGDPVFAGHFPGHPIVPGALLLDHSLAIARARGLPPIAEIQLVKFHRALLPDTPCSVAWQERGADVIALECRSGDGLLLTAVLLTRSPARGSGTLA